MAELYKADADVRQDFEPKLAKLQTVKEGILLWQSSVYEATPGRRFYGNLGWFLGSGGSWFGVPGNAHVWELRLYKNFVERLDEAELMTLAKRSKTDILADIQHAIDTRDDYD